MIIWIASTAIFLIPRLSGQDPVKEKLLLEAQRGGHMQAGLEEMAAEYIASHMTKPVVAYIAGVTAPKGKRMGHAGAIISGNKGTAEGKTKALLKAGVNVMPSPDLLGFGIQEVLGK